MFIEANNQRAIATKDFPNNARKDVQYPYGKWY